MTTVVHSHQLDSPSRDLIPRQVGKDVGDWLLAGCMSDMSNTQHNRTCSERIPISVCSSAVIRDGNIVDHIGLSSASATNNTIFKNKGIMECVRK